MRELTHCHIRERLCMNSFYTLQNVCRLHLFPKANRTLTHRSSLKMAEALGAIASIVGIVGAGAKLSIALFDFAGNIGSAGAEVRAIGTEITLFCSVLQQLERTLAKAQDRRYSISAIETTQKILDQCQFIFEEINGVVGRLQKQKSGEGEVSVDFKGRMRWVFKRAKVQQYRATLESCKITLHLMLTTLEFAERVSARRRV